MNTEFSLATICGLQRSSSFPGETPLDTASTGIAKTLLRFQLEIKLKCIAAKAVQKHGLQYEGIVPTGLIGFIENHGRREKKVGVEKS